VVKLTKKSALGSGFFRACITNTVEWVVNRFRQGARGTECESYLMYGERSVAEAQRSIKRFNTHVMILGRLVGEVDQAPHSPQSVPLFLQSREPRYQ
jgi:hypothetical protein